MAANQNQYNDKLNIDQANEFNSIVELFENRVEISRFDIAVRCTDGVLTYEELDLMSNILASDLKGKNIGRNDIVPIVMPRCKYLFVAMLGVLKAGAAYLPIDPNNPTERILFMLSDCSAHNYITILDIKDRLSTSSNEKNATVLCDQYFANLNADHYEKIKILPEDSCYVIYTSGSTGKPKGTTLTHKGAWNFCVNNYQIIESVWRTKKPIVLSTTSIAFDIFFTESIFALVNGIEIVLADETQQNYKVQFQSWSLIISALFCKLHLLK